jgi:hypothetical protein
METSGAITEDRARIDEILGISCQTQWALHDWTDNEGVDHFKLYRLGGGAKCGFKSVAAAQAEAQRRHYAMNCPCFALQCIICGQTTPHPETRCRNCHAKCESGSGGGPR